MVAMNRINKSQPEADQKSPSFWGYVFPGHASVKRLNGIVERKGLWHKLGGALFPKMYTSYHLTKSVYGETRFSDWFATIAVPGINNMSLSEKIYEQSLYKKGAQDVLEDGHLDGNHEIKLNNPETKPEKPIIQLDTEPEAVTKQPPLRVNVVAPEEKLPVSKPAEDIANTVQQIPAPMPMIIQNAPSSQGIPAFYYDPYLAPQPLSVVPQAAPRLMVSSSAASLPTVPSSLISMRPLPAQSMGQPTYMASYMPVSQTIATLR